MTSANSRRTFGQRQNSRAPIAPRAKPKAASSSGLSLGKVNPLIIGGCGAFVVAVFAVVMLGGQPIQPRSGGGGVVIIETPPPVQSQQSAAPAGRG